MTKVKEEFGIVPIHSRDQLIECMNDAYHTLRIPLAKPPITEKKFLLRLNNNEIEIIE